MEKQKRSRDDTASIVAQIHGVSAAYVRMVVNGKRENQAILGTYRQFEYKKKLLITQVARRNCKK
jgi:hypothetical protein